MAAHLPHEPASNLSSSPGDEVKSTAISDRAASTSQMGRFETVAMTEECNLRALADLSGQWIARARSRRPSKTLILDMDSSVSPT